MNNARGKWTTNFKAEECRKRSKIWKRNDLDVMSKTSKG